MKMETLVETDGAQEFNAVKSCSLLLTSVTQHCCLALFFFISKVIYKGIQNKNIKITAL